MTMEAKDWLRFTTERRETFLGFIAFMRALDEGFMPRSHGRADLFIDPLTPRDGIVAAVMPEDGKGKVHWNTREGKSEAFTVACPGHVLFLKIQGGHFSADVISEKEDAAGLASAVVARLEKFRMKNEEEDGIWVDFSYMGQHGPVRSTEFIRAPGWDAILKNYPDAVRPHVGRLMEMKEPWRHGRLVIWHGPPGTGKTYAIRALLMAWRDRFDYLVVTDPEKFAAQPSYYYEVASEQSDRPGRHAYAPLHDGDGEESPREGRSGKAKRTLFILEDSADLILKENRGTHGDKIGKLLNMTDGLFGQGREDCFLLTFNESVDDIDGAFTRPGRCIAETEFKPFSAKEAEAWLAARGAKCVSADDATLAELYARLLRKDAASGDADKKVVGFGRNG